MRDVKINCQHPNSHCLSIAFSSFSFSPPLIVSLTLQAHTKERKQRKNYVPCLTDKETVVQRIEMECQISCKKCLLELELACTLLDQSLNKQKEPNSFTSLKISNYKQSQWWR